MKEKIYTIPVTEVFAMDCECPLCILEKRLEDEYVSYFLGPSLMEPDCRMETNEDGFCRRHFELMYNKQENRLGLGLMIDTYLQHQTNKFKKILSTLVPVEKASSGLSIFKRNTASPNSQAAAKMSELLKLSASSCSICKKLQFTMERYIDVIFHLWAREPEFKKVFESKSGFCMRHFAELLEQAYKYLKQTEADSFVFNLSKMQLENLDRIEKEVDWFTRKFDYRNNDAPWGNSKDAVPRSIQKLKGYCDLK